MTSHTFVLPPQLVSPRDIRELLLEIEELHAWNAQQEIAEDAHSKYPMTEPELSRDASTFVHEWTKAGLSIETIADSLSASLKIAPVLTITLAATASKDLQTTLVKWCRTNISKQALIQFRTEPSIVGGMKVRVGSRIFDWSYRTKLLANKTRLRELVGHEHER